MRAFGLPDFFLLFPAHSLRAIRLSDALEHRQIELRADRARVEKSLSAKTSVSIAEEADRRALRRQPVPSHVVSSWSRRYAEAVPGHQPSRSRGRGRSRSRSHSRSRGRSRRAPNPREPPDREMGEEDPQIATQNTGDASQGIASATLLSAFAPWEETTAESAWDGGIGGNPASPEFPRRSPALSRLARSGSTAMLAALQRAEAQSAGQGGAAATVRTLRARRARAEEFENASDGPTCTGLDAAARDAARTARQTLLSSIKSVLSLCSGARLLFQESLKNARAALAEMRRPARPERFDRLVTTSSAATRKGRKGDKTKARPASAAVVSRRPTNSQALPDRVATKTLLLTKVRISITADPVLILRLLSQHMFPSHLSIFLPNQTKPL